MLWRPRYTPAAKCHEWTRLIAGFVGVKGEALRHVREAAELLENAVAAADATTAGAWLICPCLVVALPRWISALARVY